MSANARTAIKFCRALPLAALCCFSSLTTIAAEIAFEKIQLSDQFYSEGGTFGDYNQDGSGDVAVGPWIYFGPDFQKTTKFYDVAAFDPIGYSENFLMYSDDVNADGKTDILVLGFPGKESWWYENPGKQSLADSAQMWKQHVIIDSVDNESPLIADVDGDGIKDLVCCSGGHYIFASHAGQDANKKWAIKKVSSKNPAYQRFTHGVGLGDVNNDSHRDVIEKDGWWQNPGPATDSASGDEYWEFHPFHFADAGAQMYAVDFDGDGRNEVLSSVHAHGFGLVYHKPVNPNATQFETIEIMTDDPATSPMGVSVSQLHGVDVADINGDGIMDIVTGKRWWAHKNKDAGNQLPATLLWFETKRSGLRVSFVPHVIDIGSGVGTQITAGDVNGDGLVDIVSGNKRGAYLFLQKPGTMSNSESLVPAQARQDRFGQARAVGKTEVGDVVLPAAGSRPLNFSFEEAALDDWEIRGSISALPLSSSLASSGASGKQAVDTGSDKPGAVGELLSRPFVIPAAKFQFVAGGKPDSMAFVELVLESSGKTIASWSGPAAGSLSQQSMDVSQYVGSSARIRVVDHSDKGFLQVDHFHFAN